MTKTSDLEKLYSNAKEAITKKEYDTAASLLKQILKRNENYKDASRLLAQIIQRKRRKWYTSPFIFGGLELAALILLGIFLAPHVRRYFVIQAPTQIIGSTYTPAPTSTPTLTPTPVPLTWKRIWIGQELPRDTITVIVVDPKDEDVIYVGTENAGIYKSIDGGASWKPVHNGLGRASIQTLVIDPLNSSVLYTGTIMGGVYKTTDGGQSWQPKNSGIELPGWNWNGIIVMDHQNNQHLFFSHGFGLYESKNAGETWTQVKIPVCSNSYPVRLVINPKDSQNLFAYLIPSEGDSCTGGVYVTQDGGQNWNLSGLQEINQNFDRIDLQINPKEGNILYVYAEGLYRSSDGGKTWIYLQYHCNESLTLDPEDPLKLYCSGGGRLEISQDGGDNWTQIDSIKDIGTIMAITVTSSNPQMIFAGGVDRLYLSSDNMQSWTKLENGIGGCYLELRTLPTDGSLLFAELNDGRLYRSSDSGYTWKLIENEGRWLVFDSTEGNLYRVKNQTILASHDYGDTWLPLDAPATNVGALGMSTSFPSILYVASVDWGKNKPIYISSNGGGAWTQLSAEIPGGWPRFIFGDNLNKKIYLIGDTAIVRSDDGGLTWQNCANAGTGFYPKYGPRLTVDPRDPNRSFIATLGGGILKSVDGCNSWQSINKSINSLSINVIAIDPNNPDTLYAGTDSGAYVSFDGGQNWGEINKGLLGALVVYSIVVDPQSNVYAATPYGIFILEKK
jgi:photosystem II stability/assembly factor-like uncharacterized protein